MVRLSKKTRDRSVSPKRPRKACPLAKAEAQKKNVQNSAFKLHANALDGQLAQGAFIPKL
jgi:hypothetical protein